MRFMMLIHHDEAALAAAPQKELWSEYTAFNEALAKAAGCAAGERLRPSSTATTVRQQDGKTDVLDGPYADTKEQFAGYFFVEAPSLDEAIAWASAAPQASMARSRSGRCSTPRQAGNLPMAWPPGARADGGG